MFDLPKGERIETEIDLGDEQAIMPFEHGSITTYLGRRRTASGHRLVRSGRIVAWIAESASGSTLVGREARERLIELEKNQHRFTVQSWSIAGLSAVAEVIPEAFESSAERRGLLPRGSGLERMMSNDLSVVIREFNSSDAVRGAIAVDSGMIIDEIGELPQNSEHLAQLVSDSIAAGARMLNAMGMGKVSHHSLNSGDSSLLIATAGDVGIAVWTEADCDHGRLINNAVSGLEGKITGLSGDSGALPEGFVVRTGRGGIDAVFSFLRTALDEEVTGHLASGRGETCISIVLSRGLPLGIVSHSEMNLKDALSELTESKRLLELHRLPAGTILTSETGTVTGYNLTKFCELLATVRTRTENRQAILSAKLDDMYGFEMGMEELRKKRSSMTLSMSSEPVASLPESEGVPTELAEIDGLRRRLESSELRVDELEKDRATLNARLEEAEVARTAARVEANEAANREMKAASSTESVRGEIDHMQVELAEAKTAAATSTERASRLSRRVSELEHQLSQRAAELARAIGDADSAGKLAEELEDLAKKEAELKSEMEHTAEKLSTARTRVEDDERRVRMLDEQVEASRSRQSRAQAELSEVEARLSSARNELSQVENATRAARRREEEHHSNTTEIDVRRSHVESELKELMDERRRLLRELGDLGAMRGQTETEMKTLISQAEELAQAHEEALADIEEAEILRARLSQEPLAQALLDDGLAMEGLGPVLERLEHARTLGYSVTLLDRAVERALQVIQNTVDHVAATPRNLLSNEVMTMLERQVPATAGAVKGLTRWSVQQRLEHQLGSTVKHLVIDLETILEEYDRSITMLRRLRQVLETLKQMGAPIDEVETLLANCMRPESLPTLAIEVRRLIQVALDDIHLRSDMLDAGDALGMQQTTQALDELLDSIDSSGLASGTPTGALWNFQREGILPFERDNMPSGQRPEVEEEVLEHMEPALVTAQGDEMADIRPESETEQDWQPLNAPIDEDVEVIEYEPVIIESIDDERAKLDEELARLDAAWDNRKDPTETSAIDPNLAALQDELSEIDL